MEIKLSEQNAQKLLNLSTDIDFIKESICRIAGAGSMNEIELLETVLYTQSVLHTMTTIYQKEMASILAD